MTGTVPPQGNPQQQPVSGYVQMVDGYNHIEDGLRGQTEAQEIRDRISREIGHVAVQGTSQGS